MEKESVKELKEGLQEAQERLARLEELGDVACSDYDLRMGYNAEFNKQLARNHIHYYEGRLEKIGCDLNRWLKNDNKE